MPNRDLPERLSLIVKVARMYHERGVRQADIATRLNLSQSRVSRLLKEASVEGIVRTVVVEPPGMFSDLEEQLCAAYGLRDAVIAGVSEEDAADDSAILGALGGAGARYLESTLLPTDRVGLSSWSKSLLAVVESMSPRPLKTAESIVQVIGGVGDPGAQVQATRLAERLGHVTGAVVKYFPAPGVVGSREVRDSLLTDPQIASVRDLWSDLTTALVGVGSVEPSPLLVSSGNSLPESILKQLSAKGAVGDVCLNFLDADGQIVDSDIGSRTLGIDAKTLKAIPRRIGVAGGLRKVPAIRAALVGGWCDVLITDSQAATALINSR